MIVIAENSASKFAALANCLHEAASEWKKNWEDLRAYLTQHGGEVEAICLDVGDFPGASSGQILGLAADLVEGGKKVAVWSTAVTSENVPEHCLCVSADHTQAVAVESLAQYLLGATPTLLAKVEWGKFRSGLEPALQALSALLPFGLLWEVHGGREEGRQKAVEEWNKIDSSASDLFEARVQDYVRRRIGSASDSHGPRQHLLAQCTSWLAKLGDGNPGVPLDQIDCLCTCETVESWNCGLTTLRDAWLPKAE